MRASSVFEQLAYTAYCLLERVKEISMSTHTLDDTARNIPLISLACTVRREMLYGPPLSVVRRLPGNDNAFRFPYK